eukprot:UN12515
MVLMSWFCDSSVKGSVNSALKHSRHTQFRGFCTMRFSVTANPTERFIDYNLITKFEDTFFRVCTAYLKF